MIKALDHVQVTVPKNSESEARTFYIDFLGLKETEKPENRKANGGFWLQLGSSQVHISLEDNVERLKTKAHVAYQVESLDFWRNKFQAHKIEFQESLPFPNASAFEFRDPFGNRVELIEVFD